MLLLSRSELCCVADSRHARSHRAVHRLRNPLGRRVAERFSRVCFAKSEARVNVGLPDSDSPAVPIQDRGFIDDQHWTAI